MSTTAKHRAPARRADTTRQGIFLALFIAGWAAWAIHMGLEAGALIAPTATPPGGGWLFTAATVFAAAEATGRRTADPDTYGAGWLAAATAVIATFATWARM